MKKTVIVLFILLIISLALITFYRAIDRPKASLPKNSIQTINIAWIGPLTGDAKALGVDNLKAIILALSEYNARRNSTDPKINLIAFDDRYSAEKTNAIFNQLVSQKNPIKIYFISTYSAFNSLKNNKKLNQVIIINPIDNDQYLADMHESIFLIAKRTEELAAILAEEIIHTNNKKVAILYFRDDKFMSNVANSIHRILNTNGVNSEIFPYGSQTNNFLRYLKQARDKKTDAYVFLGYDEIGYAIKQLRQLDISKPIYSINAALSKNVRIISEGKVDGTHIANFTSIDGNVLFAQNFLKKYKKKYGGYPETEWVAMQAYDAAKLLINALVTTAQIPNQSSDTIIHYMLNVSGYRGVSGDITIVPDGSSRGIYPGIYKIVQGKAIRKQ